jgi:RNA exonuclease 4
MIPILQPSAPCDDRNAEKEIPLLHCNSPEKQMGLHEGRTHRKRIVSDVHVSQSKSNYSTYADEICVAMDCEMVGVGPHRFSVLARVSIVNLRGDTIFDSYVRVDEKVTDYRTCVSGIRPENLKSEKAIAFGKCRAKVMQVLKGKILVGHALKNDLKILNLHHPWYNTRDTSMYGPFMKMSHKGIWKPRRLSELTRVVLDTSIQQKEHCSVEDARAAMSLYCSVRDEWDCAVFAGLEQQYQMMQASTVYCTAALMNGIRQDWKARSV